MLIKQQQRQNHISNFNKKKYIFNLHSEEYAVFLYIWLLYTMYVKFLIYIFLSYGL